MLPNRREINMSNDALKTKPDRDVAIQRAYYQATAAQYDETHGLGQIEYAQFVLDGFLRRRNIKSLLDVGSGTGRALTEILAAHPGIAVRGIEPSAPMRAIGYGKGIAPSVLTDGDAYALAFADDSFDVVTEFGVLHHVKDPARVVHEMTRVAGKGVFLCDTNNWGQGSLATRFIKMLLRRGRMWRAFNYVVTAGRNHKYSDSDGLYYSFSLYDVLPIMKRKFPNIFIMNADAPRLVYNGQFEAPGICVLAIRD